MPDLKVLIGGRHYNISCNPGEENAAKESARLLDQEADLIQDQLGRLSEDKMLLLSGLLLGDKIRALKHEKKALEETLLVTQSKFNELSSRIDHASGPHEVVSGTEQPDLIEIEDHNQLLTLQKISDLLDTVIRELEKPLMSEGNKEYLNKNTDNIQDSFL